MKGGEIMIKKKGFTLIELLVVIAIIGLLSTLAIVALSSARQKSRDAKRVADIKQIQTSLELFFNDMGSYPSGTYTLGTGQSGTGYCLGTIGWATNGCTGAYMGIVPSNPSPSGNPYIYSQTAASTYTITFFLEAATGGLQSGAHTATQSGLQ